MKRMIITIAVGLLTALPQALLACPNCKEAYVEGGAPVAAGYNTSILFLMITPFVIMGVVFLRIVLSMRKKKAQEKSAIGQN